MRNRKIIFGLLGIALTLAFVPDQELVDMSILPTLTPVPPCEVRVLLDTHPEYDIDVAEAGRLLEENGYPCPYVLSVTIESQADLDRAFLRHERVSVGFYMNDQKYIRGERDGEPFHHTISFFLADLYLEPMLGHDFSVANTLSGAEWGTWIVLHELGHMIRHRENPAYSGMAELWCDHFANENYERYSIIREAE